MKNEGKHLSLVHLTYEQVLGISMEVKCEWLLQFMRIMATKLGYVGQCPISGCRRHRFCCGRVSEAQRELGLDYHQQFPPCTNGEEKRRQEILRLFEYYCSRGRKDDE